MTIDASIFNFDAMKEAVGVDPFAQESSRYARDERFYTLAKDKEGNGAALIRFLPDSEKGMIQKMFKINTTITKNGKKRFVSEFSPSTINSQCPFQEAWQALWNAGDKDAAKQYSRGTRFVSNIKIIKDPATPDNEGKVFLYEYSGAMKDKIKAAVTPSDQDVALGATPKQLFNPLAGNSFRLVAKKGANGQINYDGSDVIPEVTSIYENVEEAITDIKENTHALSGLLAPESFLTYDALVAKMKWVKHEDAGQAPVQTQPLAAEAAETPVVVPEVGTAPATTPAAAPAAEPAKQASSLDDLLNGLV